MIKEKIGPQKKDLAGDKVDEGFFCRTSFISRAEKQFIAECDLPAGRKDPDSCR